MELPVILTPGRHVVAAVLLGTAFAHGATVSFQVDPATIDNNPTDGVIDGTEFSPAGSDGTVFTMTPTNNLTGFPRFLLSLANGLAWAGGGGSTLSFDFSTDQPIQLNSFTLSSSGFFLGNPTFDITGGSVNSTGNPGNPTGSTNAFSGGPLALEAGTTYSFIVQGGGAAVQSYMASWDYTTVPEPGTVMLLGLGGVLVLRRRRE